MTTLDSDERDWRKANLVIDRTAATIAKAISKMKNDLPKCAAPQMAIEVVVRKLTRLTDGPMEAWLLQLIMEDESVREAYYSEIAKRPATVRS